MSNYFSSEFKLGILGGGQLGKMLLSETRRLDIQTLVMDPNPEAPARLACNHFLQGDLMNYEDVLNFGRKANVLTIEIEAVNVAALEELEKEGIKVYPAAATLKKIQDKSVQKEFYRSNKIPTSNFMTFSSKTELITAVEENKITFPFVWKISTGGYDGKGVAVIKTGNDLTKLPENPCIIEDFIPFEKELAVIVARNPSGEVKSFPVVEMEFHPEANQVEYVICPARISDAIANKARKTAENVSKAFNHVGLIAVEMFLTTESEILVNEVAPRPHNSGHYSIEASYTNQFEQHLRAILDLPLGNTHSKVAAVMVNLVGAEGYTGNVHYENISRIMEMKGVKPHIYGKKETRPFRKMGHVNIINENLAEARKIAEEVKKTIKVKSH